MTTTAFLSLLGPVEVGLIFLSTFAILSILLGQAIYRDAKSRGSEWAWLWALGVPLLFLMGVLPGLIAALIYVIGRDELGSQDGTQSTPPSS